MSKFRKIHVTKTAREGTIYKDVKNDIWYIGLEDGSLLKEVKLEGDVTGTTLRTILSSIGGMSASDLLELIEDLKERIEDLEESTAPEDTTDADRICLNASYLVMFDYPPVCEPSKLSLC